MAEVCPQWSAFKIIPIHPCTIPYMLNFYYPTYRQTMQWEKQPSLTEVISTKFSWVSPLSFMNWALIEKQELGFGYHCWSYAELLGNFSFHAASANPAVMGTWWMNIVTEWLKLLVYLYDVCTVFFQRRLLKWCVSLIPGKVMAVEYGIDIRP